jgi:hypothetical protein
MKTLLNKFLMGNNTLRWNETQWLVDLDLQQFADCRWDSITEGS